MNFIKNSFPSKFFNRVKLSDVLASSHKDQCSFDELKLKLKHTKIEVTERKKDCFLVKFMEPKSEYLLCFDNDGKFLHTEYEYWKDLNVKFENRHFKKS